jgi:glycosyltransferase
MKISVVTASYNSAATIGFTIESFLAQTHPTKEMLVIDGASGETPPFSCASSGGFSDSEIRI